MSNVLKSAYFESDENGNYVGYHVEGGETFNNVGQVSIEKMNIDNNRPLFLSNTPDGWFPNHLDKTQSEYRVLKIVFKPIKEKTYTKVSDFAKLILTRGVDVGEDNITLHYPSKHMEKLLNKKIDLVILLDDNDKKDPSEAALFNAKTHIVDISEYRPE